jgi:hypothetical protein
LAILPLPSSPYCIPITTSTVEVSIKEYYQAYLLKSRVSGDKCKIN